MIKMYRTKNVLGQRKVHTIMLKDDADLDVVAKGIEDFEMWLEKRSVRVVTPESRYDSSSYPRRTNR